VHSPARDVAYVHPIVRQYTGVHEAAA